MNKFRWLDSSPFGDWCAINIGNAWKQDVAVGGEQFELRAMWRDVAQAVSREWPKIGSQSAWNQVFLVSVDGDAISDMFSECEVASIEQADIAAFQPDENTIFCTSRDGKFGATIFIGERDNEYGMPVFEQVRWQIATHMFRRCEELNKFAIHASAVHRNGTTILIFGAPASGKSTLTSRLLDHGWQFISDDRVLLSTDDACPIIEPFWGSIKIRGDVVNIPEVERLIARADAIPESCYVDSEHGVSQRYLLRDAEAQSHNGRFTATDCIFLVSDNVSKPSVEPNEAFASIMESMFLYGTAWPESEGHIRTKSFEAIKCLVNNARFIRANGRADSFSELLQ